MVFGLFGAVIQSIGKTYGNGQTLEEGSQIPTIIALLRAGWALRRGLTRSAERINLCWGGFASGTYQCDPLALPLHGWEFSER